MGFWSFEMMGLCRRGDGVLDVIGFLMISVAVHLRQSGFAFIQRLSDSQCPVFSLM